MKKLYTAGELAKIAGVSSRTIRFYDEKGILNPCGYSEGAYRLYDEEAILRLQQILMFKYVGFSLEEIAKVIGQDEVIDVGLMLDKQKELMKREQERIERIIYALEQAKESCTDKAFDLERFSQIMQLITKNDFAHRRYGFYERYSTKQEEWYQWRFDNLNLSENMLILDVGGGYGSIWLHAWEQIPAGCNIVMLDKDSKGRDYLKNYEKENGNRLAPGVHFTFWDADAEEVDYEAETYDRILTNHFWGYIDDKTRLMKRLQLALKPGCIMVSTVPSIVDKADVEDIVEEFFNKRIHTEINAQKEEHQKIVEDSMTECFTQVRIIMFSNPLLINEEEAVYDYLCDSDKGLKQMLEKKKTEFLAYVKARLLKEKNVKIDIKAPMYICSK